MLSSQQTNVQSTGQAGCINNTSENSSEPSNTIPIDTSLERIVEIAVPWYFVPVPPPGHSSPVIHYHTNSSLIITCKYNPVSHEGQLDGGLPSSLTNLRQGEIYCLKIVLNSKLGLETDAEITDFLHKHLTHVVPRVDAYLQNYGCLVREYVEGVNLRTFLDRDKTPHPNDMFLKNMLQLSLDLCKMVSSIHEVRVCHCDIKPENIIYNMNNSDLRIIDFGLGAILPLDKPFLYDPNPRGTFRYMSPEASGKINQPIGFHSDMYSLGFVLYELFAREHPFSDTINFFSASAQQPELLYDNFVKRKIIELDEGKNQALIQCISGVLGKMYNKSIPSRYHSMIGVTKDLEYILQCMEDDNIEGLKQFHAGMNDVLTTLKIPYTVYGREDILDQMTNIVDEISQQKQTQVVLVEGYSGVGKSSIFKEFKLRNKDIISFETKYDQSNNIPYYAIISTIRQVISRILGESDFIVSRYEERLKSLLTPVQIEILCSVVADFKLLISIHEENTSFNLVERMELEERLQLFAEAGK